MHRGFLHYPVTDETGTPDGVGRFNHFEGGSIYWTPGTGAKEVHGAIRDQPACFMMGQAAGTAAVQSMKNGQPGPSTACAVIMKRVDERTRSKTSINELLRD